MSTQSGLPLDQKYTDLRARYLKVCLERDALAQRIQDHILSSHEERETLELKLAGCGVAAQQNTQESIKERIPSGHPYHSASYGDVCNAVDREIAARNCLEKLVHVISALPPATEDEFDDAIRSARRLLGGRVPSVPTVESPPSSNRTP